MEFVTVLGLKTRMMPLPDRQKVWRNVYSFRHIGQTDGRTDRRTDGFA